MYTIIIPTLQKRLDILKKLIENLENDSSVGEIIVINNALKPLDFEFSKLRVITKDKNLYVNPSWNLGVSEAKYDIIGLLNDDIILAPDFCTSLKNKLPENFGVIGFGKNEVNIINDLSEPQQSEINLKETDFIELGFGISMFFKKENYQNIPNELKIMYGDCFIFDSFKNRGFKNYKIQGQKIHHLGSLTTSGKNFNPVIINDKKIYKKLTIKPLEYIFSIKEYSDCKKLRFLGLNIKLYNKKGEYAK